MSELRGRTIRGYELRDLLGMGGFGAVYVAHQPGVGRDVAIKVILPAYANQPDFIRRFESEAQLVARLEHPHIIPLYDYWREPDGAYLVMRYLTGGSLRALLRQRGGLPPDEAAVFLTQIASALTVAHRAGVIHRDIKPDNILLDEDSNVYLADFGIAKNLRQDGDAEGGIVGSPAYLAPEQIRSEALSPQTDIYALGIVLYEMLTGKRPFPGDLNSTALFFSHLNENVPSLTRELPLLNSGSLDDVIQRATAKDPANRYPDTRTFAREFRQAVEGTTRDTQEMLVFDPLVGGPLEDDDFVTADGSVVISIGLTDAENPYKGLRAFHEADAADFFGREALVTRLVDRLAETGPFARFLAVVGPSGSGKSSAVKAGLIPVLRANRLPGSGNWFYAEMTPGTTPLRDLAAAVLGIAAQARAIDDLYAAFASEDRGLLNAITELLPGDDQAVLVIDQFEEAFTQTEKESEGMRFLANLAAAVSAPESRLRVIVTLRADFYDRPLLHPTFGALMRERTEVVLPLSPEELGQAIAGPARRVGLRLETGLVETIVAEVGDQPGALPLLQYTLTELYERRAGAVLTLDAYRQTGGVLGALAIRAEELYQALKAAEQRAAQQVFLRLVTLGEGTEDTRRRARQTEFAFGGGSGGDGGGGDGGSGHDQAIRTVLERFSKYRLLTFDVDSETRIPTIEVAHEALIRTWARLREWLDSNREMVRIQRRLSNSAYEWTMAGRESSYLAEGARLAQYEALLSDDNAGLNTAERAFIQASLAKRQRRADEEKARQARELELARQAAASAQEAAAAQRQSASRLRILVAIMAAAAVIMAALGLFALDSRGQAVTSAELALNNAATATIAQGKAEFNAATATIAQGEALISAATATVAQGKAEFNAATATVAQGKALISASTAVAAEAAALNAAATAQANFIQSQALRIAAAAQSVAQSGASPEIVRLLAVYSLNLAETQQGKDALELAATLPLPWHLRYDHQFGIEQLAASPDGRLLATGDLDGNVVILDWKNDEVLHRFALDTDWVGRLVFSPDGTALAIARSSGPIDLYDVASGQPMKTLEGHKAEVTSLMFLPDGSLISADFDGVALLWVQDIDEPFELLNEAAATFTSGAVSPDGKWVALGTGEGPIVLIDWQEETRSILEGHSGAVLTLAFAPDDPDILLSAGTDRTIRGWNLETSLTEVVFNGHTGSVTALAISPRGDLVASAGEDKTVRLWDLYTGRLVRVFRGHADLAYGVVFSADGDMVISAGLDMATLFWDVYDTSLPSLFLGHTTGVNQAVYSPDGSLIGSAASDGTILIWDAETGLLVGALEGNELAFSADNRLVYIDFEGNPVLYDLDNGREVRRFLGHDQIASAAAILPGGKQLISAGERGEIMLWELNMGKALQTWDMGHGALLSALHLSADGTLAGAQFDDGTVTVWQVQDGQIVARFGDESDALYYNDFAFSPDSQILAAANANGEITLWSIASQTPVGTFRDRWGTPYVLAFSPDGRYLLSGGAGSMAILWDAANPAHTDPIRLFNGHTGPIIGLGFAPDSQHFVTASSDKTVRTWRIDFTETKARLCEQLLAAGYTDLDSLTLAQYNLKLTQPTCPGLIAPEDAILN